MLCKIGFNVSEDNDFRRKENARDNKSKNRGLCRDGQKQSGLS